MATGATVEVLRFAPAWPRHSSYTPGEFQRWKPAFCDRELSRRPRIFQANTQDLQLHRSRHVVGTRRRASEISKQILVAASPLALAMNRLEEQTFAM